MRCLIIPIFFVLRIRNYPHQNKIFAFQRIQRLKDTYESVDDIDLFPGLIMEEAFKDAQIGETFVCLISDTFARLRFGDRFFYDNGGQAGSFTLPQLDQVRAHHMFSQILNFLLKYLVQLIEHPILRIPHILFVYFLSIFFR